MVGSERFQSTHLREVRLNVYLYKQLIKLFQSTHLREVRHYVKDWQNKLGYFNPRTYVRCDLGMTGLVENIPISIHAPT